MGPKPGFSNFSAVPRALGHPQTPTRCAFYITRNSGSIRGHRDPIPGHRDPESRFLFSKVRSPTPLAPGAKVPKNGPPGFWPNPEIRHEMGPQASPEYFKPTFQPYFAIRIHLKPSQGPKPRYFASRHFSFSGGAPRKSDEGTCIWCNSSSVLVATAAVSL